MKHPKRIQRRRTTGWRMPAGACCVTRPTVFGNPFTGPDARRNVRLYRLMLAGRWTQLDLIAVQMRRKRIMDRLHELRGKDLACYCRPGAPCHADELMKLANKERK